MKQKASLTLMELLVMVLVFALAAAVCLRCFGAAALLHRETALRDRAVLLAQNAAEAVKATGDPEAAAALMAQLPEEEGLRLDIQKQPSGIPGLGQALVEVHGEDALLFHLTVCWQEVAE
nr:hypothetical protein [Oscillospiraceae bacterium]